MPSTSLHYTDTTYTSDDIFYSGVARISDSNYYGSGALLYDGRTLITAAHLLDQHPSELKILFDHTENERTTLYASHYTIYPHYDNVAYYHDIALVFLQESAPPTVTRYELYREDPMDKIFNFAGYGSPGWGGNGVDTEYDAQPLLLQAYNKFEADITQLPSSRETLPDIQLVADFDSTLDTDDTLGSLLEISDTGLDQLEGITTQGDSGGPAWIDQKIAAIAQGTLKYGENVDKPNGSFGDIGVWHDLSYQPYQQWIDQSIREHYIDAPQTLKELETTILEGGSDEISIVYFFLEFHGSREDALSHLSVDYSTRDGSAKEHIDYIPVSGTLVLYPNETSAVIPVEILGNDIEQADREFYLDISNPVGGSFVNDVDILSASRTIIDDDGYWI